MKDNCGATNKSQYAFGFYALQAVLGLYDVYEIAFQVVGHTKFAPGVVASKMGSAFNCSDCFNLGMLVEMFEVQGVTVLGYDGDLLQMYKACTTKLFAAIPGIKKSRFFLIIADDGKVQQDLINVVRDGAAVPGCFTAASVECAATNLAKRSLLVLIPIALEGLCYDGIGEGTGLYGAPSTAKIFEFRVARLFLRRTESCSEWTELEAYHFLDQQSDAAIEAALKSIVRFSGIPEGDALTEGLMPYYGKLAEDITTQMSKFVPPQYVPGEYGLAPSGCTGSLSEAVVGLVYSCADALLIADRAAAKAAVAAATTALRASAKAEGARPGAVVKATKSGAGAWKGALHGPLVLAACKGAVPSKQLKADLAAQLNVDVAAINRFVNKVIKPKMRVAGDAPAASAATAAAANAQPAAAPRRVSGARGVVFTPATVKVKASRNTPATTTTAAPPQHAANAPRGGTTARVPVARPRARKMSKQAREAAVLMAGLHAGDDPKENRKHRQGL
ncbi:hypothetical protein M885DRAFT_580991 [Pelagophyceae sp. CCMP2097]|nr:hypothetical protein M885DRAFT_580991 [Pelagophyceae sp. CCMP2097]